MALRVWKEKFNFTKQSQKKGLKLKNLGSFKSEAFIGPSTLGFEVKTTFFIQNLGILSKSPKGGQFSDF